jgi:hypothetical protein
MRTLKKQIKASFLVMGIALGVIFGSTQNSKAAFYDLLYSNWYVPYLSAYHSTGNLFYYYTAQAFYYYYLAGYYGDYYSYNYDPLGDYSDKHLNSAYYSSLTYRDYYSNIYGYYGDYYYRLYHTVAHR